MKCRKCLTGFNPTPHQIKKSDYICKTCRREYDKQWRKKRVAQGLPVRGKSPNKEWWNKYYKEYYSKPEVKKHKAKLMRKYRNDPKLREKFLARDITSKAIKSGKLEKTPCAVCGLKAQAHHLDYKKPLEIMWLCRKHHLKLHLKAKAEGGK